MSKKPIVVMIRDGWGHRVDPDHNGPVKSHTPFTDHLMATYPHVLIDASGEAVGLPDGYMGNSEVGHMTIGSGRINYQAMVRINKAIESGEFFKNKVLIKAIQNAKKNKSALHIIGLLQIAGVHAHLNHLLAILDLCKQEHFENVLIHIITDGRDAPVHDGKVHLKTLIDKCKELGVGKIVSLSGRYYAMDRDKRWERTKKAYETIVLAKSEHIFSDPEKTIEERYHTGESDEFIVPTHHQDYQGIQEKDSVIFYNFRSDRPRQLTKAIIEDEFVGWERKPLNVSFVTMTEFYKPISKRASIAFESQEIKNVLGEVLSKEGKKQLRISETEKYAHVTFFFNGQVEKPYEGEDRILIPSPKVATYDLKPEMSVHEIGDRLNEEIDKNLYDVIIVNYVNGDMVGHTGDWDAVVKACEAVDENVQKTVEKVLQKNGVLLVFADHGNCEEMIGKYKTSHTINPVPIIIVSKEPGLQKEKLKLKKGKGLQDIAPTVLKLLNIEQPKEMTGESII